jgi:hypothetical protein
MATLRTMNPRERMALFAAMPRTGMMGAPMGGAIRPPMPPPPMAMPRIPVGTRPTVPIGGGIPRIPQVTPPMPPSPPMAGGMLPNATPGMMPPSVSPWASMGGMGGGMPTIVGKAKIKVAKSPKKKKLGSSKSTGVKISGLPMATAGTPKSPKFRGGAPPPKFGG